MSIRLRYLTHDIEVPEGQFLIGRSSECQMSLDDALVSRQHAALFVRGRTAEIEDLGSRNGVLVNGVRILKVTRLSDGDVLTIGQQQLVVSGAATGPIGEARRVRAADTLVSFADDDRTGEDETGFHVSPGVASSQPDKRVHALSLIGAVADKALAMGRTEEAERLVQRPLLALLERVKEAQGIERTGDALVESATHLALALSSATGTGTWIDYLFDLYAALGRPLPGPAIDQLYDLMRRVPVDASRVRHYLDALAKRGDQAPPVRFLVSRIEGLERLARVK